ncbi:hypothetical protein ACFLV0_00750 [Chloroflexota bacterium]
MGEVAGDGVGAGAGAGCGVGVGSGDGSEAEPPHDTTERAVKTIVKTSSLRNTLIDMRLLPFFKYIKSFNLLQILTYLCPISNWH